MTRRPTAIVYVDGFNLYRRCVENYPHLKWLDLLTFARNLMPDHNVVKVHYFTARVKPGASANRQAHQRQHIYLRALRTLEPDVQIHYGTFRVDPRMMPIHPVEVDPDTGEYRRVKVRKVEEKGSDVNLAVRMIVDAHARRADVYVVLTNDSDQAGPLRIMKTELGHQTGIIFPMESAKGSKELVKTKPDFIGFVTRDVLAASQLPDRLTDQHGKIHRPPTWR